MVASLRTLIGTMAQSAVTVPQRNSRPVYEQSKLLLADAKAQQDASEFLLQLFGCHVDPALLRVESTMSVQRSNVRVESLKCHDTEIPSKNVQEFKKEWPVILQTPDRPKLLLQYTYDGKRIRAKTQAELDKGKRVCSIERGHPNPNADDSDINWSEIQSVPQENNQGDVVKIHESPANTQVCVKVENWIKSGYWEKSVRTVENSDLFYVRARQTITYKAPTSKYLIAIFEWKQQNATYLYDVQTLDFGNVRYELICVIYRIGERENSGHYYASLKLSGVWYLYNDSPLERTPAQLQSRAFPSVLLFRRL
jgi:hypothetical protein